MDRDETEDGAAAPTKYIPGTTVLQGVTIADRFTVEDLAGRGGMGFVYRAIDSRTGQRVALKLMHALTSPEAAYRFKREAFLLSELRHPAIVSYLDHGVAKAGQPFLAMEWLEGEDLARRLARQPLSLTESLALLRRAAEALATAHQQDIVHRDIKPSNLFLRGGRPEDVVLLDFGLARYAVPTLVAVTGNNMVLGTPGYMAPEQASSQPHITPSADIFSLGCVLYECLTGQPPFAAPHFAAALAKILFAEPPRLNTLRPGLPPGLQVLVDRMLEKDPRRRLPDAPSLLASLAALESVPELLSVSPPPPREPLPGLAGAEQQLVSILLVSLHALVKGEEEADTAHRLALRDALRTALTPYGGRVELLADGSLAATLVPERGTATDQAALAARCALTFKERWTEAEVVLVTGLGVLSESLPVGEAMDRAGQLLRELEGLRASSALVVLDEVTAGLLGPGFLLSRSEAGTYLLHGEQLGADESRPLLGKPTPCVGRAQELALLEFTFTSCVEEPAARAVLVTAPPGMGKSRVRHEFLHRLGRKDSQALVLLGRGDAMSAGASSSLLGQALRRLCGIMEGSNQEARRARLYQRVAQHLSPAQAQESAWFLGELCAIPFPEEDSPRLRAARQDPRLMSAQMAKALVTFLQAECARGPVLLVLEDLHWSDALTVRLVDEALRELADQPFMVLALARPEVKELFPGLWSRRMLEVPLNGLSPKAGARLVREVLGPRATDSVIRRVVEQSDGNALFLEELIRMEVEGRGEAPPETVLAMLQARLRRMEPEARQVLLAASFFGRTFWPGGIQALLGEQAVGGRVEKHLRRLVEQEVIEPQQDSRFASEAEYRFRHALVGDAAHGLIPEDHRPVSHRLAGAWLERMGETDAMVLARHYQLGLRPERAALFHTRAAEQLFERHDQQGATRCIEAALACGVRGESLARLRALQALVALWMEQVPRALELGTPVLRELKAGNRLWCWLVGGLILGGAAAGHQEEAARLSELLLRTTPEPEALAAYAEALAFLGSVSGTWVGARQQAEAILGRLLEVSTSVMEHDGLVRGWVRLLKSQLLGLLEQAPWQAFSLAEAGFHDFRELGSERNATMLQVSAGMFLSGLGDQVRAVEFLREALATGLRSEQHLTATHARHYLLQALATSPDPAHRQEAYALVHEWMDDEDSPPFRLGVGYTIVAQVLLAHGEYSEAESYARKAYELLVPFASFRVFVSPVLSAALLARGQSLEARQVAELGVQELERIGGKGISSVATHLAQAEACFAQGDTHAGESALNQALRCVHERAADIPDAAVRERFLRQVPENARTLELAHQRWGSSRLG
ncbi:serine/threonine-protein kinase [Archangium lansingense]|uniref:Protein kinase n=1 Tax=Archangium lansingense TaxID=2995310 RepID=A0ABT3ZZ04_9BACT|nr:serine/threonine-protein kinase [Archangium lansinium]MCY1074603.1 protein kinase [Archangium lansinium]